MEIFTSLQCQQIVDTLKLAYNVYLQERLDKKRDMLVSSGYAWVRSNIIDDAFAKANLDFISNQAIATAGQSWEYIKFNVQHEKYGNILLLIKNGERLHQVIESQSPSQYLLDFAKSNTDLINRIVSTSRPSEDKISSKNVQLALDLPLEINEENTNNFEKFFIITFDLDENKQINHVAVTAPSEYGIIYELQNLSQYIQSSAIESIHGYDEEIKELREETDDRQVFGYEIPAEEQKEANQLF